MGCTGSFVTLTYKVVCKKQAGQLYPVDTVCSRSLYDLANVIHSRQRFAIIAS